LPTVKKTVALGQGAVLKKGHADQSPRQGPDLKKSEKKKIISWWPRRGKRIA